MNKLKTIDVNGIKTKIRLNNSKNNSPTGNKAIFNNKLFDILNKCNTLENIVVESKNLQDKILELKIKLKSLSKGSRAYHKVSLNLKRFTKIQKSIGNITQALLASVIEDETLDKKSYRYKARFIITIDNIAYIKGYELLQKFGFYNRQHNPLGVVRDHRFSIKSGIDLNIPPEYLGHINNCEFLSNKDNIIKSSNNSITLQEFCNITGYVPITPLRY